MDYLKRQNEEASSLAVINPPTPANLATRLSTYNEYVSPVTAESGGLLEYWHLIRRNAKTLIICTIAGTALGILAALPMTPVYKINTSLEILNVNQDFMNAKNNSPVTTSDGSFETSEEQTQVELLQSNSLLKGVYMKLDPDFATLGNKPAKPSAWRSLLHLSEHRPLTERERLLGKIEDSIKIRNTPRTRVLQITVKSTDPQLAVDYSHALVADFIQEQLESRYQSTQRVGDWLSKELEGIRTNLRRSEDALQAYARTSGLIFTDTDTSVETEKLLQVQQQVSAATADRVARQSSFELAQNSPPDDLPDVLNDDNLRKAQTKINDLKGEIADLSARYTPEFGKVKSAQAQLEALQTSFAHDRGAIVDRVKNDFEQAKRKEKLLSSAYDKQFGAVTGEGEKAVQYNILKRDVDSNRQLYDLMLQQMKQSSVTAALRASNVRVVDAASLPNVPYWPNYKIMGGAGLLLGLLSSFTAILLLERADRTLRKPGDAQMWTNLRELGTIPSAIATRKAETYGPNVTLSAPKILKGEPSSRSGLMKAQAVELITSRDQPTVVSEAFRSLLTSVLFVAENGNRPRLLVLTSASPAEGKTTVGTNLAIAMSEIGRRVLIIDGDLRRPRMHSLFGLPNEHGLTDLLKAPEFDEDKLAELIQETELPGLSVLPSGRPTNAAANLLYSPNLERIFEHVRRNFDMIVVDTPPMLQMTDARVVGRLADAVILVARAERTTRDAIIAASKLFAEDRVRVLGTVLNVWDPTRSTSGYYAPNSYNGKYTYAYSKRPAQQDL